ncbi:hypothetical protein [Sediminitomix flava]|uniref:Uncharacterized protein n=1 Tax=Sediminitomix flava TaxID=379075 RepID=A0A315ZEG4_SEDFL|nr:hypothetical protein [Sediminitomix flava]PWJ43921.1 hypothetical protein BC781_101271 [Sediminitomix flava]
MSVFSQSDLLILYLFKEMDTNEEDQFMDELHLNRETLEALRSYEKTLHQLDELNLSPSKDCIDAILKKA